MIKGRKFRIREHRSRPNVTRDGNKSRKRQRRPEGKRSTVSADYFRAGRSRSGSIFTVAGILLGKKEARLSVFLWISCRSNEQESVQLHAHSAHGTIASFFFSRLPLPVPLSTYLSISLAPRSTTARGTLTLMISSISGTSPLLVPFSWLSSAILRGISVHGGRKKALLSLWRFSSALASTAGGDGGDSLPPWGTWDGEWRPGKARNEQNTMGARGILTQRASRHVHAASAACSASAESRDVSLPDEKRAKFKSCSASNYTRLLSSDIKVVRRDI